MPQLRCLAKGKFSTVVVLYDNDSIIPLEGLEIRLAMYGHDIVEIGLVNDASDPVIISRHRFGSGQKVSAKHNTTLSAVALLTDCLNQPLHLAIYHNKFAAIPFNPEWLRISTVSQYRLGDRPEEGGLRSWKMI